MADETLVPGCWILVKGWSDGILNPDIEEVVQVTDKLVRFKGYGNRARQTSKAEVIAAFPSMDEAVRLKEALNGVRGERDRRVTAANDAASKAAAKLIAKATGK